MNRIHSKARDALRKRNGRRCIRVSGSKKRGKIHTFKPSACPKLRRVLKEIGIPKSTPFRPDPFQLESLDKLEKGDVLVSAPTGSGKTWIAIKAMEGLLKEGGRVWYASPLKALSNAKYEEFGLAFGREQVGILTGDRKENSGAPVIVGTTEILRNQLYDAMYQGQDLATDMVIIDEAHYMGDPDRGVVWEEVIIYLPPRVKLLLLSATVKNSEEIASWLNFVRGNPCFTVLAEIRPVPLYPVFFFPDGELTPLSDAKGLWPKVRHFVERKPLRIQKRKTSLQPYARILHVMGGLNLLPAIFFLKSRADCDNALSRCPPPTTRWPIEKEELLKNRVDEFLDRYPFLIGHPHLKYIRKVKVASHHAGHLPHWKLLIERLMQGGLLDAIFSTSTVAAGVNFPARTVVIMQSDRFNGHRFVELTATDLLQMTGRAGRRGMDQIGFAMVVPGPYQDVHLINSLLNSPPEPVKSQIHINFSMVLNLLLSHRLEEIRELLSLSFGAFQMIGRKEKMRGKSLLQEPGGSFWPSFLRHLEFLRAERFVSPSGSLTPDGVWASKLRLDQPLMIAEGIRKGAFSAENPAFLAALIAPFVAEKKRETDIKIGIGDPALWEAFLHLRSVITPLRKRQERWGFATKPIQFWPAATVYAWASKESWREVVRLCGLDEGDLAMLVYRTCDNLRQVVGLEDTHGKLSETARQAIGLLLREPVVVPT